MLDANVLCTRVDLDQIKAFMMVAETNSFTEAAERLEQSKSGISKAITALEKSLGCRLFNRNTRNVDLTEVGISFLPKAQLVMQAISSLLGVAIKQNLPSEWLRNLSSPKALKLGYYHFLDKARKVNDLGTVNVKLFCVKLNEAGVFSERQLVEILNNATDQSHKKTVAKAGLAVLHSDVYRRIWTSSMQYMLVKLLLEELNVANNNEQVS